MKKTIIFDFGKINTAVELNSYLERKLNLSSLIIGYGKNLDAFLMHIVIAMKMYFSN